MTDNQDASDRALVIRDSTAEDVPDITRIYALEVREGTASFELEPPDTTEMARRRAALLGAGYPQLVASLDDRVMGYAYAGPYRPRPAYRFSVENSVYVAADARRLGVGKALLSALIERCEKMPLRQMVAIIGDSDHVASIRLHESLGFRLVGTLKNVGFKHERWLDTVIMQRPLGPGAETLPDAD